MVFVYLSRSRMVFVYLHRSLVVFVYLRRSLVVFVYLSRSLVVSFIWAGLRWLFSQFLVPAAVAPVSPTTDLLELVTRFTEPVWPDLTLVIIWTGHTRLLKQVMFFRVGGRYDRICIYNRVVIPFIIKIRTWFNGLLTYFEVALLS